MAMRRDVRERQAQAAAIAAAKVSVASALATAVEDIQAVTGGSAETVASLQTQIATLTQRLDDAAIP